jgi:DNA-binding MarR family transcriptional regulator
MSQLNVLTREQARVRALLERYPHVSHSAVDVARYFGLDVRTAVVALQELRRRGYARRGPAIPDETAETALYDPDDTGL